jgi:hypothetical protein
MVTMNKRLLICSVLVAVVGLSSALLIFLTAREDNGPDEGFQTVVVDGKTFRIPLASTKMYQRDLQRIGGNAAVLADDLTRWLAGLWHGRTLAFTLTWITAFVSVGLFLLARQIPSDLTGGTHGSDCT